MEKKPSHRLDRAQMQIMREIAVLLEREIEDPRIKKVIITRASLSPDLRHAKVYFTVFSTQDASPEDIKKLTFALNHSVSYLRRRIGENLKLRVTPELFFIYDDNLEKAEHLIRVIDSL